MSTLARWTSRLPDLGPRARKGLKIAGYVLAGLVTFVYALHLSFPYDRLKDRGIDALSAKYDVSVGGVERGWLPGDFSLRLVQLRTRPEKPGDQPKVIVIDRLDVDVELLASALKRKAQVSLFAQVGAGRIEGTIVAGGGALDLEVTSRNLPLSDVPGLAGVIGMPMSGPGNVDFSLDLPAGGDWRKATARIAIDCARCTIGGEGAFFKPRTTSRNEGFVGQGVPVPELQIDSVRAEWQITGGKIVQKAFTFASPHLQVQLDLAATVEKSLTDSRFDDVCLRYRGTDLLKQEHIDFYNALELTGGPLDDSDGLRHLKIVGTLGKNRALGRTCGGGGDDDGGGDAVGGGRGPDTPRTRARPDLSNVPAGGGDAPPDNTPTPTNPPDPEPPDTAGGVDPDAPRIEPTPQKDDVGTPAGSGDEPSGAAPAIQADGALQVQPPDPAASVKVEGAAPEPGADGAQGEPAPEVPPEPPPENE